MNKLLTILGLVLSAALPLPAQAFLFGGFGGGVSSELIDEDEQKAAITYPDYAAKHKVMAAKISPDGRFFATLAEERVNDKKQDTLRVWNSETKKRIAGHRPAPMGWLEGFEFLPDVSGYVLVKPMPDSPDTAKGYRFNEAVVWNMDRTVRNRLSWEGEFNWGCGVAAHPDSGQVAICATYWPNPNWNAAFSEFRKDIALGIGESHFVTKVILFDIREGVQLRLSDNLKLNDKSFPASLLGYSPGGQILAVKNWEIKDKRLPEYLRDALELLDASSFKRVGGRPSQPASLKIGFTPDSHWLYLADNAVCKFVKGLCNIHIHANRLDGKILSDDHVSEIKKIAYETDDWGDPVLVVGHHGVVFAGDSLLLRVEINDGGYSFFRPIGDITARTGVLRAARFLPEGSAIRFVTSGDTSTVPLKSAVELQQLAERFRQERKACVAFVEAKNLAKVGIWGAMAEKFREGIAAAPGMRGDDDDCFPKVKAKDMVFDADVRKHNPKLAQFGMLQLELIGANEKAGGDVVTRLDAWGRYALMASLAGQPALVAASAEEMKKLLAAGGSAFNKDNAEKHIRVLEGLALAGMGREDEAFTLLARDNTLKRLEWDILNRPDVFWPLLGDRARVAYLLGIDESKVPKRPAVRPPPQPFPDPTGRIINSPGMAENAVSPAPTFSGNVLGGSAAPAPATAGGVTILE